MAEIRIEEVMHLLDIRPIKKTGKEIFFKCPHCGNPKGKLKCAANLEKNVYNCFQCGTGGNGADLFIASTGFYGRRSDAWREIRNQLDGSSTSHYEKKEPYAFEDVKPEAEADRAAPEIVDKTYRTLLAFLDLKPEHKDDLLRRTLTQEEIDEGLFATLPSDRVAICRKLLRTGCHLEGVPGFFINRRGEWELLGRPGYCCPAMQTGRVVGIQIRVDSPVNGCKYTWLSSANRYKGTSSGSPSTFFGNPYANDVIVTEGILKAYVIYQLLDHKRAVFGIPGVNAIRTAMPELQSHHHKVVYEAYDMDKMMPIHNDDDARKHDMIMKATTRLYKECRKAGLEVKPCKWDMDPATGLWLGNYKGMDDYLAAMRRG